MAYRTLIVILIAWCSSASGHEMRPAYASMVERETGEVEIEFRQPIIKGRYPGLQLQIKCPDLTVPVTRGDATTITQTWVADCSDTALDEVAIAGLSNTVIDVLLAWHPASGPDRTIVISPDSPVVELDTSYPGLPVYMTLGITHLLEGLDHVLFVVGLMLLVRGPWRILKTITSFTVAHSLTLALSILDLVRLSQAPVEAAIALSLVFIAWENTSTAPDQTFTARHPWQIALGFGLLHGLGFAGVLREIGLPDDRLVEALFLFNAGIEIGQLMIVAAMLVLGAIWHRFSASVAVDPGLGRYARMVPIYAIGSISAYWVIDRTSGLLV